MNSIVYNSKFLKEEKSFLITICKEQILLIKDWFDSMKKISVIKLKPEAKLSVRLKTL